MPWYLYLALKQLFPTGKRLPFFTVISILGVGLGVMLLVVSTAVMGGFGHEIERMILETQGELQVRSRMPIGNTRATLERISKVPGVAAATPVAQGVGMIEFDGRPVFPAFQGIDLGRVEKVMPIRKYVRTGSIDDLDDESVILSTSLAYSLGARIGDTVTVTSPLVIEKLRADEVYLPRELTVVGTFEIGHQHLDNNLAIVSLRRMQDLYALGEDVHGINIRVEKGADVEQLQMAVQELFPMGSGIFVQSWKDSNREFLFVVEMEKNLIFFLLLFIIIVAAFSLTSSLLTTVVRKTKEIGLLGALGARPHQLAAGFFLQGLLIGFIGLLVGLAGGFLALHYRGEIMSAFMQITASKDAMARFYGTASLPVYLSSADFWKIVIFSIIISSFAGVIPAFRAARMKPVEALRNE